MYYIDVKTVFQVNMYCTSCAKFNKTFIYRNSENQLNEAISQGYLQLRSKHYQLSYFTLRYQQVKQAKTSANI